MHNIVNNIGVAQVLSPQTIQGSALNTGNIDMQGVEALSVVILVGNIVDVLDSTHRIDLKIEHADDDGTGSPAAYAACTDDHVLNFTGLAAGLFQSVNSNSLELRRFVIDYRGGLRFVKVTATPVTLTTGGPIAMLALKGLPHERPVDNT